MIDRIREEVDKKDNHDFRGEEGLLYRVPVGNEAFWAKKWHRSHTKDFYTPLDAGGSSLSPFWHRAVGLSYSIVHELFPKETINMIGSYDERTPRILGTIRNFDPLSGKPITVSTEAQGDPELCEIRDSVMREHYQVLLAKRDEGTRRGASKAEMEPFFNSWRHAVNARMVEIMGPEIDLDSLINSISPDTPDFSMELARRIRKRNPQNVIADFLQAGISVGHPEVNFVPGTKESHPYPPHGTFVEFSIYNSQRLVDYISKKFANNPRKRDELMAKFRSFEICNLVDKIFDKIFLAFVKKTQGLTDTELLGKICLALEKFRLVTEKFGLVMKPAVVENLMTDIIIKSTSAREAMARLQREFIAPMEAALV